ncbi:uncharacterized protein MONBRDRAFT_29072 [Monosiga brevicollis MX1]|uniref:Protein kinase domain-containing protein n=1 Tax=Monosiga brevicollis TaxID=81824 RepID=A9VA15_MONBE|nr:uncharacterized protein MONBRDRAFT_29072 [Monosiga brevicollis MX1]EDQ85650.1 predicted protein [Monosiga brevicollis MX1]|eukprot:XP_001749599.1 hypothetical protein [Monosiga brevicollis MX1]
MATPRTSSSGFTCLCLALQRSASEKESEMGLFVVTHASLNVPCNTVEEFKAKYVQQELLHDGGFGRVYSCVRRSDNLPCVVKVVSFQMYDIFWRDTPYEDDMYIVMLRYETDLLELVVQPPAERGPLRKSEKQRVFLRTVLAVQILHENAIIHRDLKLENILLKQANDMDTAVLADFGCARVVPPDLGSFSTRIGTTAFWAPEMVSGIDSYTHKVDIWMLGCLLYTLWTGSFPFGRPEHPRWRANVITASWPKTLIDDAHVLDLITHCLLVDPEQRPDIGRIRTHSFFVNNYD